MAEGVVDNSYDTALAVLAVELISGDPALDAAAIIACRRAALVKELIREQQECQDARVKGMEQIVPMYNNQEFKAHFTMERETFERLHQVVGAHLSSRQVTPEKGLLASLWLLGNRESFQDVANRFDLSQGFLHRTLLEVCNALEVIQSQFISWPIRQEQNEIAESFLQKTGFPGVVGCIDGCHIPIPNPVENKAAYINRKGFCSIQVQAICDDNLRFLDIITGWPGAVHDGQVFRKSPVHELLKHGNVSEDHHLLGDSAYTLAMYMMVPFTDTELLGDKQNNYNIRHSSARLVIERAFGLLKSKFRRLQYLDLGMIEDIPSVIISACVLHNFILLMENIDIEDEIDDASLPDENVHHQISIPPKVNKLALHKRNNLANLLAEKQHNW